MFVLALTAAAYSTSLAGEFQFDDVTSIVENVAIRDIGRFLRDHALGVPRPLTNLTFALDFAIAGLDVRAYHLTNLALHLATVLAVLGFTRRVLRRLGWQQPHLLALWVAAPGAANAKIVG